MNPAAVLIATGAGTSVILALVAFSRMARAPRAIVRARLTSLEERTPYAPAVDVLRDRRASRVRLLDLALSGRAWSDELRHTLDRAGLRLRVAEYLALRLVVAALLTVSAATIAHAIAAEFTLVGALAGLVFGGLAPSLWVRSRIARRRRAIETELVELCELMASMMQSGFGYLQALAMAAEQLQQPLAGELAQMRDAVRLGAGVDDALDQLNERLGSRDFDMLATAIAIQRRSGGSLAGILRNVAQTVRERQLFRLEIGALTSRERYSAVIVAGFPLLLLLALTAMVPATFGRLFTDPLGHAVLGIALASDVLGYLAIRRVTRLEV
ncbi:MAG: type II secretion system F family protein [Chloroflexi bacterium]|nr:type II secretion system F family protein [Chloroflexota bacterium]